jgi:FdhD protein
MSDRPRTAERAADPAAEAAASNLGDSKLRRVPVTRVGRTGSPEDATAVEEPLEIRLHGTPFAVIMRTPGDDQALAAGFLLSEGVIASSADVGAVERCRHPDHPESHNVVDVYLLGDAAKRLPERLDSRRKVTTTSSCGLCGRVTIESLKLRASPLRTAWTMTSAIAAGLPAKLRMRQDTFEETGGLHAAGLFTPDGTHVRSAEDVGRHSAVDKVIGGMLLDDGLPLDRYALVVSGRTSFEIVQKAWIAGIPLVSAVSAPTSLAIDLATEAVITLLGFTRDGGFNIYSHPDRIVRI